MNKPLHSSKATRKQPASPGTDLLSMEEVVALIKTTRPTFYRWLRAGRLKGTKVGRQWRFLRADIDRFVAGQEPEIDLPTDLTPFLDLLRARLKDFQAASELPESKLAQALHLILTLAAQMQTTDLHFDPQPNGTANLRFRIDGTLQPIAQLDLRLLPPLIKHWKSVAGCQVNESSRPQDGRFVFKLPDEIPAQEQGRLAPGIDARANETGASRPRSSQAKLEVLLSVVPVPLGEAFAARLLDPAHALLSLENLNYAPHVAGKLQRWLNSPWGFLVVTGPTNTGKTATLYAALQHLARSRSTAKIMSIEDPVEYVLPDVTQVPIGSETFGATLRAILKAAPDIIMLAEIRDLETLALAQQSALNGHLVLTALHAGEAADALLRMLAVGANPFVAAEATKLVIAQRLIRLLCPKCSVARQPAEDILALGQSLARIGTLRWASLPKNFRESVGCKHCHMTGYHGRTVIAEALELTSAICRAMQRSTSIQELRTLAVGEGMTTMAADGLQCATEGKTSLSEVVKVLTPIYQNEFKAG